MRRVVSCAAAFIALLLLVGTVAVGVAATTSAAAPVPVRICHIPVQYIGNDRVFARHALFATRYLAPRFPNLNVSFDYATANGGPTMNDVALGLLSPRAQACDGFVGPQWSSVSVGISALVNVPWVSHTATSSRLSDKDQHPWFSRMLPTDAFVGTAMAGTAAFIEWKYVSIVCVDDAYGQSLLSGARVAHSLHGGIIEVSPCVLNDGGPEAALAAMQQVKDTARGKVVMMAASASSVMLGHLVDAIVALEMHRSHVFMFSESPCATKWHRLRDVPGAFCVTYGSNASITTSYDAAWRAHDNRTLFAGLENLGIPTPADPYEVSLYSYLIHDCVLALLTAFSTTYALLTANSSSNGTAAAAAATMASKDARSEAVLATLRAQVLPYEGATGALSMSPSGDRPGAIQLIKNVVPSASSPDGFDLEAFARWTPLTGFQYIDPRPRYWLASGRGPLPRTQPVFPADDDGGLPSIEVMAGLLAAIFLLGVSLGLCFAVGCSSASFIVKFFHSGMAGVTALAVLDIADVGFSAYVAYHVFEHGRHAFTDTYRYVIVLDAIVAAAAVLFSLVISVAFIRAAMGAGLAFTPGQHVAWRVRTGIAGTVSMVFASLPLLAVSFTGLALSVRDGRDTSILLIAMFISNSVLVGAKAQEPLTIVAHAIKPDCSDLHRAVEDKFPLIVPLTTRSPNVDCARVLRFITKVDAKRAYALGETAKHIVTDCWQADVSQLEFFAVVWRSMAIMHSAVHLVRGTGRGVEIRAADHDAIHVSAGCTTPSTTATPPARDPKKLMVKAAKLFMSPSPRNDGLPGVPAPAGATTDEYSRAGESSALDVQEDDSGAGGAADSLSGNNDEQCS